MPTIEPGLVLFTNLLLNLDITLSYLTLQNT
jgi:hypothetical protein